MFKIPLVQTLTPVPQENFWNSLLIYIDRPHILNRRLTLAAQIGFFKVTWESSIISELNEAFTWPALINEIRRSKRIQSTFVSNILEPYDKNNKVFESSIEEFKKAASGNFVSIRILYPRTKRYEECIEVVILDKDHVSGTFFCACERDKIAPAPDFPYKIENFKGIVKISVNEIENADTASAEWLADLLFPKLLKWSEEYESDYKVQKSLSAISEESYSKLYLHLKTKYGDDLVKNWPENTDPLKFVYEDLAIAAYLICLWERTNPDRKPSFVDVGCGNGLLVYILNEEGYPGFGVDIRKRKIWDWYPEKTDLRIETITPSNLSLPESDWIIGNHSDELTPWIPVIAARSSFNTNFFLLPCCCYDFIGRKYKRNNSGISIYSDYLLHVQSICTECGFDTEIDKLRIPSTKRTALIGHNRIYEQEDFESWTRKIEDLIRKYTGNFQARNEIEAVRNCTHLDKELIRRMIENVSNLLLLEKNFLGKWNKGSSISLKDLAGKISKDDLKQLKNECGGLQTLIRNHRYIFNLENGLVALQKPLSLEETAGKYKSKPCWFFRNHPNGCFHDKEANCAYKHL